MSCGVEEEAGRHGPALFFGDYRVSGFWNFEWGFAPWQVCVVLLEEGLFHIESDPVYEPIVTSGRR